MFFIKKSGKTTIVYPGGKDSDFQLNCFRGLSGQILPEDKSTFLLVKLYFENPR